MLTLLSVVSRWFDQGVSVVSMFASMRNAWSDAVELFRYLRVVRCHQVVAIPSRRATEKSTLLTRAAKAKCEWVMTSNTT